MKVQKPPLPGAKRASGAKAAGLLTLVPKTGGKTAPAVPGPMDYGVGKKSEQYRLTNSARGGKVNKARPDLLAWSVISYVIRQETHFSGLFIKGSDGNAYIYCGRGLVDQGRQHPELICVSHKSDKWNTLLSQRYGLIRGERITGLVTDGVLSHIHRRGEPREVRRFACWRHDTQKLYLSRYDGTCYELDGESVQVVRNGEYVLFVDDDGGTYCEADYCPNEPFPLEVLQQFTGDLQYVEETSGGQTAESQERLLSIWMIAIAFPDLLPTKPLLLMTGSKGSGKSSSVQRIQTLVHGKDFVQQLGEKDQDDFGVTILRTPIALLDNVDNPLKWLQDTLCAYATSGSWYRRKKFEDTTLIEIKPQAFIALATKNPQTFRRDDIADRCLVVRLDRREEKSGYTPLSVLLQGILLNRPRLYGQWLWYVNRTVKEVRKKLPSDVEGAKKHRLADFAKLSFAIGRAIGYGAPEVVSMLEAAQDERSALIIEGEATIEVLDRWLDITKNHARALRIQPLFAELAEVAAEHRITFVRSANSLGRKLRELREALEKRFDVTIKGQGDLTTYTFRRL